MPDPLAVLYLQVPEPSSCPYCGPPGTWTDEATLINAARVVLQHCSCRVRVSINMLYMNVSNDMVRLLGIPDDGRSWLDEKQHVLY